MSDGAGIRGHCSRWRRRARCLCVLTPALLLALPARAQPTLTETRKRIASDGESNDEFGVLTRLDGDRMIVGAWLHDALGKDAGAAYVFRKQGSAWAQVDKLLASDGAPTDELGKTIDMEGSLVLVGSPYDDDNGERSDSAYFFDLTVGDFNRDGRVGPADLLLLLASWGAQGEPDITGDGAAGADDLMRLLGLWGRRFPIPSQ